MDTLDGSWLKEDIKLINVEENTWVQELGESFTLEGSSNQYPILVWEKK